MAVVGFNAQGVVEQPLTGDLDAAVAALSRIETSRYTRIDLGIREAREELVRERGRPGATSVMIVLTDCKANPMPVSVAVEEAEQAKRAGVTIFAIDLGEPEQLDAEALAAIASGTQYYYQTPDSEDLKAIYEEIAVTIPCPAVGRQAVP